MGLDEIQELQKEWRIIVLDKLNSVEKSQSEIKADMVEIKTSLAKQQTLSEVNNADLQGLKVKVDKLENFKYKLIGGAIAFQAVIGVIAWWIEHVAK